MNGNKIDNAFYFIRIFVAIATACLATLLILFLITDDPVTAINYYFLGPFSSQRRFGIFMSKFIPYILTGLGMCFCYASNRFSPIGEGTYSLAGCFAALIAILTEGMNLPHAVQILLILVVCALVSAVVSFPTAVLREKLNINELVTSIMMNYVLLYITVYILKNWIIDISTTSLSSKLIPENSKLIPWLGSSGLNSGLIIALVLVLGVTVLFYRTPLGCKIRIGGSNENFAKTAGINMPKTMIIAQVLCATLSGLGGALNIISSYDRYMWTELTGFGFDGLMVAVLARSNPILVPFGAFILAYMRTGAYILNYSTNLSTEFIQIIQAAIIIMIAAKSFLINIKNNWVISAAKKGESKKC